MYIILFSLNKGERGALQLNPAIMDGLVEIFVYIGFFIKVWDTVDQEIWPLKFDCPGDENTCKCTKIYMCSMLKISTAKILRSTVEINRHTHSWPILTNPTCMCCTIIQWFHSSFLSRPYNSKNPFLAPLKVIRELHKGGDRSCMHIEMDITGSRLSYVAGDHVAIFPSNDPQLVNRIGELLAVDLDTVFTLTNVDGECSYHCNTYWFACLVMARVGL